MSARIHERNLALLLVCLPNGETCVIFSHTLSNAVQSLPLLRCRRFSPGRKLEHECYYCVMICGRACVIALPG